MGRNADAIAEGVAIATAAARLAVKNHILVGTIAQGGVFDAVMIADQDAGDVGDGARHRSSSRLSTRYSCRYVSH